MLLCCASFYYWPESSQPLYVLLKTLFFIATVAYFSYLFWQLRDWQCNFTLNVHGNIGYICQQRQLQLGWYWCSPWLTLFYGRDEQGKCLFWVWSDMLTDTNYRHLCRLLRRN